MRVHLGETSACPAPPRLLEQTSRQLWRLILDKSIRRVEIDSGSLITLETGGMQQNLQLQSAARCLAKLGITSGLYLGTSRIRSVSAIANQQRFFYG